MLRVLVLSVMWFVFSGSVEASQEELEELNYSRKGIVSCEAKERLAKIMHKEPESICDIIDKVKKEMDGSKSYRLNLRGNIIDNEAALEVLNFMLETPQIKVLDLSCNQIKEILDISKIEEKLETFLKENQGRQIILTGNKIFSLRFEEDKEEESFLPKNNCVVMEAY